MSATYRDVPDDIDPIAFLFGDIKLTVPESSLTFEEAARLYDRALQAVDVKALHGKSDDNPDGLESLQSLLRYEPGPYGKKWLRLEATKEVIQSALPDRTPYQLLYLVLFGFKTPSWNELPTVEKKESWGTTHVVDEFSLDALLFGKNGELYFVTATWRPEQCYYHQKTSQSHDIHHKEGTCIFHLDRLVIEPVNWSDVRVLDKIKSGEWSDISVFLARLQLALNGTATILESRMRRMRQVSGLLNKLPIFYGR